MRHVHASQALLDAQRHAFNAAPYPSLATRCDRLTRLATLTRRHRDEIAAAISADVGHRAEMETRVAEVATVLQGARFTRRKLRRWMRPRRRPVGWRLLPARAKVHYQPLGVIGIISPANYPWNLAWLPAIDALAAGNRVMIKPSENTPATSALMARLAARYFAPEELCVVEGDAEVARHFSALPFDHLLFTGSATIGREVSRAAAANLTPVTLELGGKSPALVAADADLEKAAERIAFGKWLNAGRTCIAPDYVMVEASRLEAFLKAMQRQVARFYPEGTASRDYSSVPGPEHRKRLEHQLHEARNHGCRIIDLGERLELPDGGAKLPPTLVVDPSDALAIMREEIFGPWLPVLGVRDMNAAIARVQAGHRPLALYAFTEDAALRQRLLEQTHSGGVVFNDTLWHNAVPALPFGGIGESGSGAYHGEAGFQRFSHARAVFTQSRHSPVGWLTPPYRRWLLRVLGL